MKLTLGQFYKMLEAFDWFYVFSDDSKVEKEGELKFKDLGMLAFHNGPKYVKLMEQYRAYVWSGPAWKTEKKPKPEIPAA